MSQEFNIDEADHLPASFFEDVDEHLGDPPPGPHPSKVIDVIVKDYIAPLMKKAGYRKKAKTFWLDRDDVIAVLNIQKSQWNSDNEADFYINVGLYWRKLQKFWSLMHKGQHPKEYDCMIKRRFDTPDGWSVKPDTNIEEFGSIVSQKIESEALPWLEAGLEPSMSIEYLREYQGEKVVKSFKKTHET